jgi:hypothetical protein
MFYGAVIHANHPALAFTVRKFDELCELQQAVGGFIEMVPGTGDRIGMYVCEDGLREKMPPNPIASGLARQDLVGDVVLFSGFDKDGNELSITEHAAVQLLNEVPVMDGAS